MPLVLLATGLLACGAETGATALPPPEPGEPAWVEVKPLNVARSAHVAVALLDGRVLVVGGIDLNSAPTAEAEIFDPATGAWTPTGAMMGPRSSFAGTVLPSGEVLVSGGAVPDVAGGQVQYLATAEIFDPVEGAFRPAAPMMRAHVTHTLTPLRSGLVLAVGGRGQYQQEIAEVYDPASGAWALTANFPSQSRHQHTATRLADGRVLIAGGYDPYGSLAGADLFEEESDSFAVAPRMHGDRTGHVALRLTAGPDADRVLVAGGTSLYAQVLRDTEVFDPVAGAWALGSSPMSEVRCYHAAIELDDGEVVIAGGQAVSGSGPDHLTSYSLASAEVRDPNGGAFEALPPMHTARAHHTITRLGGFAALVAGGDDSVGVAVGTAEIFYRNGPCGSNLDCSGNLVCSAQQRCVAPLAVP